MKDNEIAGVGNHNTALFWEYDTRTARRWNLDPVDQISISNYSVLSGNPISRTDPLGNTDDHIEVDSKEKTYRVTPNGDATDDVSERKYTANGSVPVPKTNPDGSQAHYQKGAYQKYLKGSGYSERDPYRGAQSEEFAVEMAAGDGAFKVAGKGMGLLWAKTFGRALTETAVKMTTETAIKTTTTVLAETSARLDFMELQTLTKTYSGEMNAFFKSGGKEIASKEALVAYRELATRMLNNTGGAYQKVTEAAAKLHTGRIEMIDKALGGLK